MTPAAILRRVRRGLLMVRLENLNDAYRGMDDPPRIHVKKRKLRRKLQRLSA